jgi:hypothetical protein
MQVAAHSLTNLPMMASNVSREVGFCLMMPAFFFIFTGSA